ADDCVFQRRRLDAVRNPDDAKYADRYDREDDDDFGIEIFAHGILRPGLFAFLLLPFLWSGDGGDRALHDFDLDIVGGQPELHSIVAQGDYRPAHSTGGGDSVAGLEIVEHLLPLLLLG